MKMQRRQVLKALGILGAAALTGCGQSTSSQPAASSIAASVPAVDDTAMVLTQSTNVKRDTFKGLKDYTDFEAMAEKLYLIPGLVENQIPQGFCRSENTGRLYISAYSSIKLASVIMVLDDAGNYVAEYHLKKSDGSDFTGHVGGVAVTDTTMYVSNTLDSDGSYSVMALPLADLPAEGRADVTVENIITVPVSPSLLAYNDNILWVGNFYHPAQDYNLPPEMNYTTPNANDDGEEYGCYLLGYDLTEKGDARMQPESGKDYAIPDYVFAAPWKIQGMVYDPVNGCAVLSQSYGRTNNAALLRYNVSVTEAADTTVEIDGVQVPCYVLDAKRLTHNVVSIPMTEGLTLDEDRRVLVLYESGSNKYKDGKHRTDYIWRMTFAE